VPDRIGHHDYLAGCSLLASLLAQSPGVDAIVVREGWPADERVLESARALVVYSGGAHKHVFLGSPERIERVQQLVERGIGLVMVHQAASFPPELAKHVATWLGGAHVRGESNRGHWATQHRDFPAHVITSGVEPWAIKDGWLNGIEFIAGKPGVTPLVWSGPRHGGSSTGGDADVVGWAYERPDGGRSFCFTGVDGHSAWSAAGVRRLMVNGILWSAGLPVPETGAPCAIGAAELESFLTPRGSRSQLLISLLQRGLKRVGVSRR
jgi:hypothetical protein